MNRYQHLKPSHLRKNASLQQGAGVVFLPVAVCQYTTTISPLIPNRPFEELSADLVLPTGPALAFLESQYAKKPKNPV
ncbi:MAG TPA: hypothetical protein VG842_04925 [Sediminibacterium sp.]|nr:hypothetical protein [Sediminibacterium sp.]